MNIETSPMAETGINPTIEVEETFNTITEFIGPTIETEVDQEIIYMEIAIGGAIIPKNYRRDNYRQDYGNQGYWNRNRSLSQDCGRSRQRYRSDSKDNSRNRSYDRS